MPDGSVFWWNSCSLDHEWASPSVRVWSLYFCYHILRKFSVLSPIISHTNCSAANNMHGLLGPQINPRIELHALYTCWFWEKLKKIVFCKFMGTVFYILLSRPCILSHQSIKFWDMENMNPMYQCVLTLWQLAEKIVPDQQCVIPDLSCTPVNSIYTHCNGNICSDQWHKYLAWKPLFYFSSHTRHKLLNKFGGNDCILSWSWFFLLLDPCMLSFVVEVPFIEERYPIQYNILIHSRDMLHAEVQKHQHTLRSFY